MRQRLRNKKRRIQRVEEAAIRQAAYDALTQSQKVDRTTERSFAGFGPSRRETTRLNWALAESGDEVTRLDILIGAAS